MNQWRRDVVKGRPQVLKPAPELGRRLAEIATLFDEAIQGPAGYFCGVHVAGTADQVMGFIDQKKVVGVFRGKEPLEMYLRVKEVVVVANHDITKKTGIQLKFKRVQGVFAGVFFDNGAGELVIVLDEVEQGRLQPIVIA